MATSGNVTMSMANIAQSMQNNPEYQIARQRLATLPQSVRALLNTGPLDEAAAENAIKSDNVSKKLGIMKKQNELSSKATGLQLDAARFALKQNKKALPWQIGAGIANVGLSAYNADKTDKQRQELINLFLK